MKILFITYHSWNSKRQGGFHKFAEHALRNGHEVVFFSFPRPFLFLLRSAPTYNFRNVLPLLKGKWVPVGSRRLLAITCINASLAIYTKINRYLKGSLFEKFERTTFPSLKTTHRNAFQGATHVVIESTSAITLFERLRRLLPEAKFIYRPSDPLLAFQSERRLHRIERIVLVNSDLVLLVNKEGETIYKHNLVNWESVQSTILSNGVDITPFRQTWPMPAVLSKKNTALYVGARPIDWQMLFEAASLTPEINYVIVSPKVPSNRILNKVKESININYVPGISRSDVARWITNANCIIVPNPRGWYRDAPWGVTAKYYQAMAANKPIVAYEDSESLIDLGIPVTYSVGSFVQEIRLALKKTKVSYDFDFQSIEWSSLSNSFLTSLEKL